MLTWLLILYAEFVVMGVMLLPSPFTAYSMINSVLFQIFAFMACASHLRTMFTDPVSKKFDKILYSSNSFENRVKFLMNFSRIINSGHFNNSI